MKYNKTDMDGMRRCARDCYFYLFESGVGSCRAGPVYNSEELGSSVIAFVGRPCAWELDDDKIERLKLSVLEEEG